MPKRNLSDLLLDLSPTDLAPDQVDSARKRCLEQGIEKGAIESELQYLRIISARRVQLPSDAYFARARARLYQRVAVRPANWWDRVVSLIVPSGIKPVPSLVGSLAIVIVATMTILYFSTAVVKEPTPSSYGPYVSLSESYKVHVGDAEEQASSPDEWREYREILLMSAAILGSPSSLSRSRVLAGDRI